MRRFLVAAVLWGAVLCWGCSKSGDKVTQHETGFADLYAATDHGTKRVLDDRFYDRTKLTAGHRDLPKNALVRVTNLGNGRRVEVVVNDRDLREDCVIKLSDAAAKELKIGEAGEIKVSVEMRGYGS